MAAGEGTPGDSATADVDIAALMNRSDKMSAQTLLLMANLASSHWFDANKPANSSTVNPDSSQHQPPPFIPTFTAAVKRKWTAQLAEIEAQMKATATAPRATTGALAESLGFGVAAPATTQEEEFVGPPRPIPALPTTVSNNKKSSPPDELIRTLIQERNLTASQALAFKVAARHFFTELTGKEQDSLRLFMHGEAGTGKTVVVRLLRELLERFGKGNEILFMAPTGKAASAIGGATQHATFALRVQKKGTTSDDLASVRAENTHANRIRYLQDTFRHVRWLFFDEVSMTSCEMMAEIDQALRIGRQLPDDVFGRVNVLFAGDLCQLAPVGTAALYSDASLSSRTAESRTMMELGRAAWLEVNEVINFTEQMRMQDVDMAESLSRLRVRKCTEDDASLFNTNVLRSSTNLNGINLQGRGEAIVLTRTNETVRALNHQKAAATAKWEHRGLVVCAANDTTTAKMTAVHRSWLLNFNGDARIKVGLGRIPLYEGMPVVYRGGNQSVSLGITNGAFATVHSWQVRQDNWGHTVADGIILHFPNASPFQLESLPERCLPIIPASTSFKMSSTTNNKLTEQVKRKQLPIQPGFAMTVHSAQGITSKGPVIVDLRTGGFGAYVAATRATKKADLILVAPIKMGQLNTPPLPKNLRSELKRLDRIAAHTRERHDHDDWTLDGTELRNKRSREDDLYDQPGPSVRRRVETLDT